MEVKTSAKKQIIGGFLTFTLFVLGIAACSDSASTTPPSVTPTKSSEPTSYQFLLEKSSGRGIVEAADWAPDGSSFALATSIQVDLYNARTFEVVATLDTNQWTKLIAYSPDSQLLAAGGEHGTIQIWDVASRKLLYELVPNEKHIFSWRDPLLAFSTDSKMLVSALNQTLYLWDLSSGKMLDSFPGHLDGIDHIGISPNGKVLIVTGSSSIYVRDILTRELLYPPILVKGDIEAVFFEQDAGRFKTVNSDYTLNYETGTSNDKTRIQTWDLSSGKLLEERLATRTDIHLVEVDPTQKQVVLTRDGEINIWDTSLNKVVFSMQGKTSRLASIAISLGGEKLIAVGDKWGNGVVQVWDLNTQNVIKTLDQYDLSPAEAVFSPNEKLVAIASTNHITQIREVESGRLLHSFNGGNYLAFSPDSKTIAFATGQNYDTIVLANTETGEYLPGSSFSCPELKGIAFHPDGKTIVFGGYDCDLQLRNVQTGELVLNLSQVEGNEYLPSYQPIFSPDGKRIILGGYKPRVLDAKTGKTLREMEAEPSSTAALSPDGRYLLFSGMGDYTENEKLQVWDVAADRVAFNLRTLQDQYDLKDLVFSPDGRLLAIVGKTVELWDLWNGKPLAEWRSSEDPPVGMMLSADHRTLITVERNGTVQHWSIQPDLQLALDSQPAPTALATLTATPVLPTIELTKVAEVGKGNSSLVSRSPDGRLAAFFEENELKWFDAVTLEQLGSIELEESWGPIVFSPDNKLAVVPGFGAQIVDLEQEAVVGHVSGGNGGTSGYTFTRDGHYMAYTIRDHTTGGPYHRIGLWDAVEHKEAFADYDYFRTLLEERYHTMSDPAISPDGKLVAAGHSDKRVYIWDLHTGESYLTLEGHAQGVTAVDFSPNGQILASASRDGTIRLWNPSNGRLIKVLTGFSDHIYDVRFSPDGHSLRFSYAEGEDQSITLDTGQIRPIPTSSVTADPLEIQQYQQGFSASGSSMFSQVLFSPDGKILALAGQNILLWDVSTQKLLTFLDNSTGGFVRGIAFSAKGTLLAVTSDDDHVRVWDVKSGKLILSQKSNFLWGATVIAGVGDSEPGLARGGSSVSEQGLAFSPASDLLAFGNDNAIEVWDVRTSERVSEFANREGLYATQFSFSEDGKRLYVILNRNREAQIWDIESGKLISQVHLTDVDPNAYTAVALSAPFFARNNSDRKGNGWIELWNLNEKKFIKISTATAENEPLLFSSDRNLLVAKVGGSGIHFWRAATGELIYQTELDSGGLAISADHRLLAAGLDGRAIVYDLRPIFNMSSRPVSPTPQATSTPRTLVWPTATPIPLPTKTGEITSIVIQAENATEVTELARFGSGTIERLLWSPAGSSILTSGSLGVSQYSLQESTTTWRNISNTQQTGWTFDAISLLDGPTLAVSVDAGRVRVWNVSTKEILVEVEGSGEPSLSPDGSLLVYTDPDGSLQTWDVVHGQPVATLKSYYTDSRWPIFSPDNNWIAAVQSEWRYADSVRIWNARTGAIVNALGGPDNDITDFSFSADGRFLVGAAGGSAWIWDLHPGVEPAEIQLYEGKIDGNLNVYPHTVTAAALSPDGQTVAIGTSEHQIWIYDRNTQQSLFQLKGHSSAVRRLSFRPGGKTLASVDEDGVLMIWDMASRQSIAVRDDHKGPIDGLINSMNGDVTAWGAGIAWQINAADGTLQHATSIGSGKILAVSPAGDLMAVYNPFQVSLLDAKNGKFIQTLEGEAEEPVLDYRYEGMASRQFYSAVFSRDGRYLATAGAGGVWYYDLANKNLLQQLPGSNAQKVAFTPDGNWLLTSLDEQANPVAVYDIHSGSQVFSLDEYGWGGDYLQSAFSPDGRWVGTVKQGWDEPSQLVIYDTISHQIYKSLPLVKDVTLTSLAFSPSGNLVAAGRADGAILFIDFPNLKIVATLTGHHGAVERLIFSPDGQYLISASVDGTIRTWGLR